MKKKSLIYKILKFFVSIFYRKREFIGIEHIGDDPVIVVGNHAQMHGPIISEIQIPFKKKTWCIGNVLTVKEFIKHAKTDFWGKKSKSVKWFFMIIAYIIAPFAVSIFNSADIVAVYRDGRLINTLKKTVNSLEEGYNIIIFPECSTSYNNIINQFEENFVDVAKLYYKRTGKTLSFVPMYNAVRLKKVLFGSPIKYDPNVSSEEMKKIICDYLKKEITKMAISLPKHEVIQYTNKGRRKNPMSK